MDTRKVSIDNLLLDPNNYRIRGNEYYSVTEEENAGNVMVQKRIMKMIKESNGIKELLESFKENGYLPIDNIIVRPYPKKQGKYVVVEGNRRVTTLKTLKELYEDGMSIGNIDPSIFKKIEVVVHDGEDKDYEILMGLRHVSGVKEWGDYEQSELISNLANKYHMNSKQISESLGIGTVTVKRRLNTYYATKNYLTKFTMAINEELRQIKSNVKVSALCPGPTSTEFMKVAHGEFSINEATSEYVAKYGIDKLLKGKMIIIPTLKMKLGIFFLRFIPYRLQLVIAYHIQWRKTNKI